MLTQQNNRPRCQHCKVNFAKPNGTSKHGFTKYHKYCSSCAKVIYNPNLGYLLEKKNVCENCGFVAEDKCQMDVIYKDNNKKNKDKNNLLTLCSNCSRLYRKRNKNIDKSILDITIDADIRI